MKRMDEHPDVLEWSSEELTIPYRSPKTGRIHRYFPDFLVKRRNTKGVVETVMVEIKPKAQILPPKKPKKATTKTKTKLLNEQITFAVNQAKWEAARAYCKAHNYLFEIITEKELF